MRIGRLEIKLQPNIKKIAIVKRLEYLEEYSYEYTKSLEREIHLNMTLQNENELRFQKIEKAIKMLTEISKKLSDGNK